MTNIAEIPVHTGNDLLFSMVFIPAYSYVKKKSKGSIDLRA
jgi:hypothetical protein